MKEVSANYVTEEIIDGCIVVGWEIDKVGLESYYVPVRMNKEELDKEISRLFELRDKLTATPHPREKEAYKMGCDDELYGNHAPGWGY